MADITFKHVVKTYDKGNTVVPDLNLEIKDKEFVVLVGPSGCGKSTTLRMIAGLEEVSGGELYIGDRKVNDVPPKDRDIAMVFQSYALYPHMTVYKNMAFALELRKVPKDEIDKKVREAAKILGLEEYLNELSRDMLDYNYQIWTGNHMLDMILNQKEKEAEKQKTQMQISTEVFTTLPFSDREIISLFGNLLDNALEACEQIKEGERWIHIKMKKKNQLLYIEIVNAAKNTGIQTDENFVSKKDGMLHGYGMKNIRDIVEQYNGMFQCKSQEDRFEVVITIYG